MAQSTLYRKYLWLLDTIHHAGRITRDDINRQWAADTSVNEYHTSSIPERTFHHWKDAILEMFGIIIECDKTCGNVYYIENLEELQHNTNYHWLLNTLSVAQLVSDNRQIKNRIILEDMPSDTHFLSPLMQSIRTGRVVQITYQSFGSPAPYTFDLQPYCLKVFRRRWYVVGKPSTAPNELRTYCLDRIKQVSLSEEQYAIPDDFDAHEYFRHYFGVCRNVNTTEPKRMVLEVLQEEADYLRTLPLHHSQKELYTEGDYVYFEYNLVPTFDLFQELQMHGSAIRVVEPQHFGYWLRKEAEMILDMYKDIPDEEPPTN